MKNRKIEKWNPASENGSTLVELMVALSLLLGVLLPAGALLTYISQSPVNKQKVVALGRAQTKMEELLQQTNWKEKQEVVDQGAGWKMETEIAIDKGLAMLRVRVSRRGREIIELTTYRQVENREEETGD